MTSNRSAATPAPARIVNGHVIRDGGGGASYYYHCNDGFSFKRFFFVLLMTATLVITNPANELILPKHKKIVLQTIFPNNNRAATTTTTTSAKAKAKATRLQESFNDWHHTFLDPPLSLTNYGIFAVEERSTKMVFLFAIDQTWSCHYYSDHYGKLCTLLSDQLCHGGPLLLLLPPLHYRHGNTVDYAYTAHRCICLGLIVTALLAFCYGGQFPPTSASEPIIRAILTSFGRSQFSLISLGLDLMNAGLFVYPALVRLEKVLPTLQEGVFAAKLGLPQYCDFIAYVVLLVLFLGGGANALTNFIFAKHPCFGFDTTVAASIAYCRALETLTLSWTTMTNDLLVAPQTAFWTYLPITALLGGSPSHAVAWLLAGMFGMMLGEYHIDSQNWLSKIQYIVQSIF